MEGAEYIVFLTHSLVHRVVSVMWFLQIQFTIFVSRTQAVTHYIATLSCIDYRAVGSKPYTNVQLLIPLHLFVYFAVLRLWAELCHINLFLHLPTYNDLYT